MDGMHDLTEEVAVKLAAKLVSLQGDRTDGDMGRLLGVTRHHWGHIKAGRRKMSYALVKRAARHFPELYPIVLRDLTADSAEVA